MQRSGASNESPTEKSMVDKLYMRSKKIKQSKLYEHFTKLLDPSTTNMDNDIKRAHRLIAKKKIK